MYRVIWVDFDGNVKEKTYKRNRNAVRKALEVNNKYKNGALFKDSEICLAKPEIDGMQN